MKLPQAEKKQKYKPKKTLTFYVARSKKLHDEFTDR